MSTMNTFSIEDAFEDDDQMRVYGPTTENIPLASKKCTKQSNSSFSAPMNTYTGFTDRYSRSDSLNSIVTDTSAVYDRTCWWRHPRVQKNCRLVVASFVLFFFGSFLIIAGLTIEIIQTEHYSGVIFLVVGFICFIPGSYHVVYIYCAVTGRKGYTLQSLRMFK